MDRRFPQFLDAIEWNLVRREELIAQQVADGRGILPISPRNFGCDRHCLMIGVETDVPPGSNWVTGGWAEMYSYQSPSSTSVFQPLVRLASRRLRVDVLNLVVFPKLGTIPYLCQVTVPKYFKRALIEVWKYDGDDQGVFDYLQTLEQKIDILQ